MIEKVPQLNYPLHIKDSLLIKIAGWVFLCGFLPVASILLFQGEIIIALTPLIFGLLGLMIVFNTGSLEIDQFTLTRKILLGTYQMRWDEVEWIEYHEQESTILLCGAGKRLAIPSPTHSSGKDWNEYVALLATVPEQRGIPMERTWKVMLKWSKNTRVRA